MQLLQKLLNKLNGLYYKQDYLCIAKESFEQPLFAYLVSDHRSIDVTNHHVFVGYSPLIFAFPSSLDVAPAADLDLFFTLHEPLPNELINEKDAIATLSFKRIKRVDDLYFYEGKEGGHGFISKFHQMIFDWQNRLYNNKPGNVYLPGNLLTQVQIAYSIPRTISLITISDGQLYNLFPTDLHGQIDDEHYIISLRHRGKAALQVERAKKILISEIDSSQYKTAYALGRNHMQELRPRVAFSFSDQTSRQLRLPLPPSVTRYRELELGQFFDHGIHRIFLFKILNQMKFEHHPSTLAHVHNVYATWRHNKGLPGNYLMR